MSLVILMERCYFVSVDTGLMQEQRTETTEEMGDMSLIDNLSAGSALIIT